MGRALGDRFGGPETLVFVTSRPQEWDFDRSGSPVMQIQRVCDRSAMGVSGSSWRPVGPI